MTRRLQDAKAQFLRLQASLEELEEVLAARPEPDRSPLQEYIFGELPQAPVDTATPSKSAGAGARLGRKFGRAVRAGALPVSLAAALSLFGLIRLQPANTLWYQELTLTANVETGEFECEPLALEFVSLTHPQTGKSTLTYALSGGGTQGFDCPPKDISHLAIPVGTCFNPEVKADGPLIAETHPGNGAWKYDAKNSKNSDPSLVKWDSQTEHAPFGGKGPFDPAVMRFSITFNVELTAADLTDAMGHYKAGGDTPDLGEVKVPSCPLPQPPAPLKSSSESGPASVTVEEAPEVEPEPEVEEDFVPGPEEVEEVQEAPENSGPASVVEGKKPRVKPTPTPTPIGISIRGGSR